MSGGLFVTPLPVNEVELLFNSYKDITRAWFRTNMEYN